MKHLLTFFLIVLLIFTVFFSVLCLNISFDGTPSLDANFCETHALLMVDVELPTVLLELWEHCSRALSSLPDVFTKPPSFVIEHVGSLFSGIRNAYLSETKGCTAFR